MLICQLLTTLKKLRERALLSQGELAQTVGVHRRTIIAWEQGVFKPRPKQQRLLVQALHCTPDELLTALEITKGGPPETERPAA